MTPTSQMTLREGFLWGAAMALTGGALVWISMRFSFGTPVADRPIEWLVVLLGAMGLVFMLMAGRIVKRGMAPRGFVLLLGVGLLLRGAMFFSEPVQETDFYRYLWDGAVVAHGENPYRPIPQQVMEVEGPLTGLGRESGVVIGRINHPELRTVYPPVAQGFFAMSYLIAPWSPTVWRGLLLGADVATLALLSLALYRVGLPREFALLYWLNPIVLKEIHNGAHMDVLLAPFVLGALLLAWRKQVAFAVICLAVATGLKVWPVLLLPIVLRAGASSWRQALVPACLYGALVGAMSIPILMAGLDATSGFTAYTGRWEMNNAPSLLLIGLGRWLAAMDWFPLSARTVSSVFSILLIGGAVLLAIRRPVSNLRDLAGRMLAVSALLFLISPTQFPWYAVWFLPLLAIRPHPALLLYAVTLPLYYLRFRYNDLGYATLFDHGVVWVEHGPILVLLLAAKWKPEWLAFQHGSRLPVRPVDAAPNGHEVAA